MSLSTILQLPPYLILYTLHFRDLGLGTHVGQWLLPQGPLWVKLWALVPENHSQGCCDSFSTTLDSVDLRSWFTKRECFQQRTQQISHWTLSCGCCPGISGSSCQGLADKKRSHHPGRHTLTLTIGRKQGCYTVVAGGICLAPQWSIWMSWNSLWLTLIINEPVQQTVWL